MKITIYELLGLIKDGKAPKRIRAYHYSWIYDGNTDYTNDETKLFEDYLENVISTSLNDEVEIIEPIEDEFIDIEELGNNFTFEDTNDELTKNQYDKSIISIKINDLIKNQKKIIDKLKEEGK